jgi:hypothetical protein
MNPLIDTALKERGIHQSRADIVAEALADYFEKPEVREKLRTVPRSY